MTNEKTEYLCRYKQVAAHTGAVGHMTQLCFLLLLERCDAFTDIGDSPPVD